MIEIGEILTLEDDQKYIAVATTLLDDVNYVYLMHEKDYSKFMFCAFDQVDGLYEVEDDELLQQLLEIFNEQLNGPDKYVIPDEED